MIAERFEHKLIGTYLLLVAAIVSVAGPYILSSLKRAWIDHLKASLLAQARLVSHEVTPALTAHHDVGRLYGLTRKLAEQTSVRITVIAPDGTVLADSEGTDDQVARMDNHLGRPEVQASLAQGVGSAVRRSDTTGLETLYLAIPLRQDGVNLGIIRLGMLLSDVNRNIATIRRTLLIGGGLALILAVSLGFMFARRVTRPIAQMMIVARRMTDGDFSQRIAPLSRDEIGQLGQVLNTTANRLDERLAQLEDERAKGAAILDSMVEGVVAVDKANRILFINASARRLFRVSSIGVAGRPFLEVIRNKEMLDLLERTHREGTFARQELEIYTPIQRVLQVHAAPLEGRGQMSGAILVVHDVTELHRLEVVRTEFVANVSHELRTPLTVIRGTLETLLEGHLEDRQHAQSFLATMHKHTERMGRLLDDLLDLSNIELGKAALDLRPTSLPEVVESAIAVFRPQAARQSIELRAEYEEDLPPISADRDRLAQILINLLDNSLKFTPDGGAVIVAVRRVPKPGPEAGNVGPETTRIRDGVEIAVRDTGIGIPSQHLPRITERFYRVDTARSRELGGTGLGLAIVKHLVEAHSGHLLIESELNKGTAVRFTLPTTVPQAEVA